VDPAAVATTFTVTEPRAHRQRRNLVRLQLRAALAISAVLVLGCDSGDDADTATARPTTIATSSIAVHSRSSRTSTFCSAVTRTLDREFPSGGGSVVSELRCVDRTDLDAAQQAAFVLAVEHLEQSLARFNAGESPDGWSTEQVAGLASAFCGRSIDYQVVTGWPASAWSPKCTTCPRDSVTKATAPLADSQPAGQDQRLVGQRARERSAWGRRIRGSGGECAGGGAGDPDVDEAGVVDDPGDVAAGDLEAAAGEEVVHQLSAVDRSLQRGEPVAREGGLFEALLRGEHRHPVVEADDDDVGPSGHRLDGRAHGVVVAGPIGHAGARAGGDTELGRGARRGPGRRHVAGAEADRAAAQRQRSLQCIDGEAGHRP